tara:strand:+ start:2282 stop:3106 length:825 start_codon:yes stop_codon:yes gene_type:complete
MKIFVYNDSKTGCRLLIFPLLFFFGLLLFLYFNHALCVEGYVSIQKDYFYQINAFFGQYPNTMNNLTQLGDASVLLSFLIIFVIYAPKIWESLISALVTSALLTYLLKGLFGIPRPAQILTNNNFIIIGKKLVGFSSLPSGHSCTVLTIFTVVLFAFMPKKTNYKIIWVFIILSFGILIAFSRVGVGAHFPLDVIFGSIQGFTSGLIGIYITQNFTICRWVHNQKYWCIFIIFIIVCSITLINKIFAENLVVYYLAFLSLIISFYKFVYVYFKK